MLVYANPWLQTVKLSIRLPMPLCVFLCLAGRTYSYICMYRCTSGCMQSYVDMRICVYASVSMRCMSVCVVCVCVQVDHRSNVCVCFYTSRLVCVGLCMCVHVCVCVWYRSVLVCVPLCVCVYVCMCICVHLLAMSSSLSSE